MYEILPIFGCEAASCIASSWRKPPAQPAPGHDAEEEEAEVDGAQHLGVLGVELVHGALHQHADEVDDRRCEIP